MTYLVNRLLYSFHCMERYIDKKLRAVIFPLVMNTLGKFMYSWNPFGYIKRNRISPRAYMYNKLKLDIYMNSDRPMEEAKASIVVMFIAYSFLLVSFLKYKKMLHLNTYSSIYVAASIIFASFLVVYITALRRDKYKEYFKKFRREKNRKFKDTCWNIITFVLYVGILYCIAQSVILWHK